RTQLLPAAEVLVCVQRPAPSYMAAMRPGSVVLGFLRPLDEPGALEPAVGLKLTTFAVELIPRITRAQAMDALSSMATVVGYKAVLAMKRGSVIVDLAASTGGNVSLSRPDEVATTANGVTIFAPLNLAATVPYHASQLFSRNMTSFLQLLSKDGQLTIDMHDDVVGPSCVTHQGQVVNARVAALLGEPVTR